DFARRQPAMLFGAAAAVGFLLFRMIKTTSLAASEQTGGGFGTQSYGVAPHADSPPITSGQFHGPSVGTGFRPRAGSDRPVRRPVGSHSERNSPRARGGRAPADAERARRGVDGGRGSDRLPRRDLRA